MHQYFILLCGGKFMVNIGIIGYGIVGKATAHSFNSIENTILFYDKFKKSDRLGTTVLHSEPIEKVVKTSEFIFVCLPTPYKGDRIDLSILDENIEQMVPYLEDTDKITIIKSTVIPGTTRGYSKKYPKCHFCFNPEFLREASYIEDALNPDRIIIGADNDKIRLRVADLYRNHFPKTPMFLTDPTTAELVKYYSNAFLATKVILANEIYDLCQVLGVSYDEVKKMVAADPRIGPSHMDVTSLRGFGGKCLPKDLIALRGLFKDLGIDSTLLDAVWEKNLRIRKKRDWEEIPFVNSDRDLER
jgi:UDPglucose 6-dehydrogenase